MATTSIDICFPHFKRLLFDTTLSPLIVELPCLSCGYFFTLYTSDLSLDVLLFGRVSTEERRNSR